MARFLYPFPRHILWKKCFLTDRDEMSTIYRRPSIDASYQVSVHLAQGFQRKRLKCEKLMDDAKWWQKLTLPLARWAKKYKRTNNDLQNIHIKLKIDLVGSMYGKSSIKIAHFVPIRWQKWLPQAILVSDWSISKNWESVFRGEDF
jgi:hypothetical protein